ncbi:MAG: TlpA family protein disulfide reductase [bacterium]|nr:TlpA family protein disulfide reductase [bacterium]
MSTPRTFLPWILVAFLGLGSLLACSAGSPGSTAKDFTLPTQDGKPFTLSALKGEEAVVLVFFASWCQVCSEQVPHIKRFVRENRGDSVSVYGISVQETSDTVDAFIADKRLNFPVLLDADTAVAEKYGVRGIPTFIGIDLGGKIAYRAHSLPEDRTAFVKQLTGRS